MSIPRTSIDSIYITGATCQGQQIRFPIASGNGVFLGSAANCGVQLQGADVSPIHCRVSFDGQSIHVHDWLSTTGTYIDGTRVDGEAEACVGSLLQIGNCSLKFNAADETEGHSFETHDESDSAFEDSGQTAAEPAGDSLNDLRGPVPFAPSDLDEVNPFGQDLTDSPWAQLPAVSDLPCTPGQPVSDNLSVDNCSQLGEAVVSHEDRELQAEFPVNPQQNQASSDEWEHESQSWSSDDWASDAKRSAWEVQSIEELSHPTNCDEQDFGGQQLGIHHLESRIRDLILEAELSDQRINALEDQLLAAESAQAAQTEERQCLEAWLQDIERKFSSREEEHAAELQQVKQTLAAKSEEVQVLHQRFSATASTNGSGAELSGILEHLRTVNSQLEKQLQESRQQCLQLEQRAANAVEQQAQELRAELTELAVERAELARQRHELVNKLAVVGQPHKEQNAEESEMACRLRALREHLREIHHQEQQDRADMTLASRLTNLWRRVTQ